MIPQHTRGLLFHSLQFAVLEFFLKRNSSLMQLQDAILQYMVIKECMSVELNLPGLTSYLSAALYSSDTYEQSKVVYVDIMSMPADSKDTVLCVLKKLHTSFILELGFRWLIVVGDAKTYDILQSLRRQYGSHMQWLLPFPGDWHILYNYQKVLLKVYGEAGLLELAKVAGHRAETLTSLAQASHFKRTHHFIIQSFEAMYRFFLRTYVATLESSSMTVQNLTSTANTLASSLATIASENDLEDLLTQVNTSFTTSLPEFTAGFTSFMDSLCSSQKTSQFWYEFLTKNALIYMALFIAIRNGDWMLRMAAIKSVAAVFSAFDRPIYQRLIPQHLADLLCYPTAVMQHLQKGAFTVHITEGNGHAVGLDEAHEMKIKQRCEIYSGATISRSNGKGP